MLRAALVTAVFMASDSASGQVPTDKIEGYLEVVTHDTPARAKTCGNYFVVIPAGRQGTQEGVGFKVPFPLAENTWVLTAFERVTVVVDDSMPTPWATVELKTGWFYTTVKISNASLASAPCLSKAKRG